MSERTIIRIWATTVIVMARNGYLVSRDDFQIVIFASALSSTQGKAPQPGRLLSFPLDTGTPQGVQGTPVDVLQEGGTL